jgi:tape measure domain-containing protein
MANKLGELSYEIILNDSNFQSSLAKFKSETKNLTTSTTAWLQTLGGTTEKQLNALNKDWLKNQKIISDAAIATGVASGTMIKNVTAIANPAQRAQAAFYNAQIGIMQSTKSVSSSVATMASVVQAEAPTVTKTTSRFSQAFSDARAKVGSAVSDMSSAVKEKVSSINSALTGLSVKISKAMTFDSSNLARDAQAIGSSIGNTVGTAIKAAVGLAVAGLGATIGLAVKGLNIGRELQNTRVELDVQLGSKEAGKKLFSDLRAFAAATPFETRDLAQAAVTLKGFGLDAKKLVPTLKQIGNAAGGNAQKLQGISVVTGQIIGAGKLQGQDILQLINNSVPIYDALKAVTGKTAAELKKMGEEGKLSSELYLKALEKLYGEGGRLGNLAAEQSKTIDGLVSTAGESFKIFLAGLVGVTEDGELRVGGLAEKISKMLAQFNTPENQARVAEMGAKISEFADKAIAKIIELAKEFNAWWQQNKDTIIPQVKEIATDMFLAAKAVFEFTAKMLSSKTELIAFSLALVGVALAINPVGVLLGSINLLISYWIINWPIMKEGMVSLGEIASQAFVKMLLAMNPVTDRLKGILDLVKQITGVDGVNKIAEVGRSGVSKAVDGVKGLFGKKAMGGTVNAGQPYMVGEQGREMFVPKSKGTIIPNHALSDGSGNLGGVTINMSGAYMLSSADDKRRFAQELQNALTQASSLNYAS